MDQGKVRPFDTTLNIFQKPEGIVWRLLRVTRAVRKKVIVVDAESTTKNGLLPDIWHLTAFKIASGELRFANKSRKTSNSRYFRYTPQ